MQTEFPTGGVELTQLLVVSDLDRSRRFDADVLGAEVCRGLIDKRTRISLGETVTSLIHRPIRVQRITRGRQR